VRLLLVLAAHEFAITHVHSPYISRLHGLPMEAKNKWGKRPNIQEISGENAHSYKTSWDRPWKGRINGENAQNLWGETPLWGKTPLDFMKRIMVERLNGGKRPLNIGGKRPLSYETIYGRKTCGGKRPLCLRNDHGQEKRLTKSRRRHCDCKRVASVQRPPTIVDSTRRKSENSRRHLNQLHLPPPSTL
jgi:hypothetical protein